MQVGLSQFYLQLLQKTRARHKFYDEHEQYKAKRKGG